MTHSSSWFSPGVNLSSAIRVAIVTLLILPLAGHSQMPNTKLNALADRFVQQEISFNPLLAYSSGLPGNGSRFPNRTPSSFAAHEVQERKDLSLLGTITSADLLPADRATYATLHERLEADLQLRVCRTELWNVNHYDGWQSDFTEAAERQPVGSAQERRQALLRWRSLPRFVHREIANLRLGLENGYSSPKSLVRKVIQQMDILAVINPEQSVFYSPGKRSQNAAFQKTFRKLILTRINPSLAAYRSFLETEYLPKAREGVAISDLPNGPACYQAYLRASTTLKRSPQEVYDLGQQAVRANGLEITRVGEAKYHSSDVPSLVAKIKSSPEERFASREDLLHFSQQFLERAKSVTARDLVASMPRQEVVIRPLSAYEEGAGVGSRFQAEPNPDKPAVFLIRLADWRTQTRSDAEILTVHETVPGHYLQKSLARELQVPTRLSRLIDNDAYAEGWARYAEALAEEGGIYDTENAGVMRRLWPAHGMVVDPGLHAFHWTRQQAVDYMVASGHFSAEAAEDYVDRIAVMPGQLTAYDTGALFIEELRAKAQARLGARFDLRRFNRAVLEEGVVPLQELRAHLELWMASN